MRGCFYLFFFYLFLIFFYFFPIITFFGGGGVSQSKTVCQTVKFGKIQKCNYLQNIQHVV